MTAVSFKKLKDGSQFIKLIIYGIKHQQLDYFITKLYHFKPRSTFKKIYVKLQKFWHLKKARKGIRLRNLRKRLCRHRAYLNEND